MISSEELSRIITENVDLDALSREAYEPRGIFHSEMAAILSLVKSLSTEILIESGRARGQSTYILGKYLPNTKIISVELTRDEDAIFAEKRVSSFPNVELVYGDALKVVPEIIKNNSLSTMAVLIDGPKYIQALELLQSCFRMSENVKVGFVHDLSKDRDARYVVPDFFANYYFTDNDSYVEKFKYLDQKMFGGNSNWRGPYRSKNKTLKSYGPTLGIFIPSPEDLNKTPGGWLRRAVRKARRLMSNGTAPGIDL